MRVLHLTDRSGRTPSFRCIFTLLVSFALISELGTEEATSQVAAPPAAGAKPQEIQADAVSGVYLPTDRSLSRAISRARERIAAHEYHEALTFLQGILGRDEDAFLEKLDGDREQLGLKAAARRMIADLPREGRDAYELLHGATARRQLEAALRSGNQAAIANVVRQFSHTLAGDDAALVLAHIETDQGRRLAAAQIYQGLIASPQSAARFEPQLSVAAALNHSAAGNSDLAAATLRSIAERMPSATVTLSGKQESLPTANADFVAWLSKLVGAPSRSAERAADWLTLHGEPSRNLQISGGPPHLRARWQARVVNEPTVETYLTDRMNDFDQRGVAAIPAAKPIAVGDTIVMRTPENVVAIDWQTGKRVWETRDEQELESEETSLEAGTGPDPEQLATPSRSIDGRMWDDALLASLSSDGERIFVLRGISVVRDDEEIMAWRIAPGFRRGIGDVAEATNQLAAYDLASQGKLAWELDGDRAAGPLAGAFFLGAPLTVDGTLYVMAEINSSIFLLAIDPATGNVRWQQRLVELEQGIARDVGRRQMAASPSYSAGILICPTAASAVVAIDVVKREFAWVYRYPREAPSPGEIRGIWQQAPQAQVARANDRWLDGSAVISDDRVLITPPESGELHCLDLKSGKLLWKQRRGNLLFIGGIEHDRALMIGANGVQAMRLSDGAAAWNPDVVPLPSGVLPAGQGYMSEGFYYLPLSTGEIAAIELSSGTLSKLGAAQSETILGNLIGHRGSIISQSPLALDKFEQLTVLKQRTEAALAANADDASALREMAELKRTDGAVPEAVELLKRAYQLAPDDVVTQQVLVEILLTALAEDYALHRSDVPLVAKLLRDRDQQIELMRIDAAGLDQLGKRLEAVDAYLRLADFTAEEPANLRVGPGYAVRSDRWISGRLATIWTEASAAERNVIAGKIAERRPALDHPQTAASLRDYLAHFGQLPGASDVRLALARYLIDRSRGSEAELELLQLLTSPEPQDQAEAARLMTSLASVGQIERNVAESRPWPRGQIDVVLVPATAPPRDPSSRAQAERQSGFRPLRIEQDFGPAAVATQWFISTDCTELAGRNAAGNEVFRMTVDQNDSSRQIRDSGLVHAARMGRFLYVALTGRILAIDSSNNPSGADEGALWQASPFNANGNVGSALNSTNMEFPIGRFGLRGRRAAVNPQARVTRRPVYNAASDRKRISGAVGASLGSLGPVSPRGVVFQQREELQCVDPLSGEVLWIRTDLPPACELFGDDELVFVADVSENVVHMVRVVDGELVGKQPLASSEWLVTAGRNLAQLGFGSSHGNRVVTIRITNASSQAVLFDAECTLGARFSVVEPNALAILEPSGKFQLVDVRTGKLSIDEQLAAVSDLQGIYTMQAGDELFLAITGPVQQKQFVSISQFDCPLVNGHLYAFSLKTGKPLWPGPAVIRNRGLVLSQPQDSPLLVLADRKMIRDAESGGGSQLRVLCLDKRTGQRIYRDDSLTENSPTRLRIRTEREENPAVVLELGGAKIQLTMTDRPRPPQPPVNDDLEAPREIVERGLRGLGRRVGGALRGVLENPGDAGKPRPPINQPNPNKDPNAPPQEKPPADNDKQETDDD